MNSSVGSETIQILAETVRVGEREGGEALDLTTVLEVALRGTSYVPGRELRGVLFDVSSRLKGRVPRRGSAARLAPRIRDDWTRHEVEAALREACWRAARRSHKGHTVSADTVRALDWADSVDEAVEKSLMEADSAGVRYTNGTHLLIGILAAADVPMQDALRRSGVDPKELLQRLRAGQEWAENGEPHAPYVTMLEATGGIAESPAWPLRLITSYMRRSARKRSRYGGVVGDFLEEEAMRQAVRIGSPIVTSAHAIIAIVSLAHQLSVTGFTLNSAQPSSEAGDVLVAHGISYGHEILSAARAAENERDPLPASAAHRFWVPGLPWSRTLAEILDGAIATANQTGHAEVGTSHILMEILHRKDSAGHRLIVELGADPALIQHDLAESLAHSGKARS
jgi:hypothetical protein